MYTQSAKLCRSKQINLYKSVYVRVGDANALATTYHMVTYTANGALKSGAFLFIYNSSDGGVIIY